MRVYQTVYRGRPRYTASWYEVSVFPPQDRTGDKARLYVRVERVWHASRGGEDAPGWGVRFGQRRVGRDGSIGGVGTPPVDRDFLFRLDEALDMARRVAPKLRLASMHETTAADLARAEASSDALLDWHDGRWGRTYWAEDQPEPEPKKMRIEQWLDWSPEAKANFAERHRAEAERQRVELSIIAGQVAFLQSRWLRDPHRTIVLRKKRKTRSRVRKNAKQVDPILLDLTPPEEARPVEEVLRDFSY